MPLARAGQRGPGRFGEDLPVDDGAQGGAGLRGPSPALPVCVEAGVEGGELCGQVPRIDVALGRSGGGRSTEPVRERGGDLPGQRGGVVQPRHRVGDRPPEQAARRLHRKEGGDRTCPGRLPGNGDLVGVAPEGGDVPLHPLQRRDLSRNPRLGGASSRNANPSAPTRQLMVTTTSPAPASAAGSYIGSLDIAEM